MSTGGSHVLGYALTPTNKNPNQIPSFNTNTFKENKFPASPHSMHKKKKEGKKQIKRMMEEHFGFFLELLLMLTR